MNFTSDRDAALALEAALDELRQREQWASQLGPFQDSDDDAVLRVRAALRHLTRDDADSGARIDRLQRAQ